LLPADAQHPVAVQSRHLAACTRRRCCHASRRRPPQPLAAARGMAAHPGQHRRQPRHQQRGPQPARRRLPQARCRCRSAPARQLPRHLHQQQGQGEAHPGRGPRHWQRAVARRRLLSAASARGRHCQRAGECRHHLPRLAAVPVGAGCQSAAAAPRPQQQLRQARGSRAQLWGAQQRLGQAGRQRLRVRR